MLKIHGIKQVKKLSLSFEVFFAFGNQQIVIISIFVVEKNCKF